KKMKKFFALLLTVLLLATPVLAAESWTADVVVEAAAGTATIDGNDAEWANAKTIAVTLDDEIVNKYGVYQGNWGSDRSDAKDFSTEVKFMWDKDALYILEVRKDDDVILDGDCTQPWAGGDGNLIFLQVIDAGAAGNEDGYSHHIFYAMEGGAGAAAACVRICDRSISGREVVTNESVKIVGKKTNDGWMTEIAVPWTVFAEEIDGFVPGDNVEIGMSMVPIDCDEAGADFSQLCWVNVAADLCPEGYDFGGWATLKLAAAPVAETEAPATEAPATQAPAADAAPATPVAPATADMGIVAAAAVLAIAAGAVLTMKKR
ncbi:MAG: hypothetical protein J6I45_00490, partial [Clostridia bacterium]|nr:hypothetical protein [Clostridia bacterium]